MDAIADKAFTAPTNHRVTEETPSLLTVIFDTSIESWSQVHGKHSLKSVLESLCIGINAHLALNNANRISVIGVGAGGARYLYPTTQEDTDPVAGDGSGSVMDFNGDASKSATPEGKSKGYRFVGDSMYRQFKVVDETLLSEIHSLLMEVQQEKSQSKKSNIGSALSMALAYVNKVQVQSPQYKARVLYLNLSNDEHLEYIHVMNCIFAAQKMKVNIDVCQLHSNSVFLQQGSDLTGGIYLDLSDSVDDSGLVQYFTTTLAIDPSLRSILLRPNNTQNIDFRASCFLTGKVVDVGFVCSVCLCILSVVPGDEKCPACDSVFDPQVVGKLKRKPVVRKTTAKKRRTDTPTA